MRKAAWGRPSRSANARAFANAVHDLHALNLLFVAGGGAVSRDAFDAFAQPLAASDGFVKALEYQRFVSAADRAAFEAERRASLYALATLTGRPPAQLDTTAAQCTLTPKVAGAIPIGDGASLIARRPDVRAAERRLASDARARSARCAAA